VVRGAVREDSVPLFQRIDVYGSLLDRLFVERMDQNEEIFVRYMNDEALQRVVTPWMAAEAYRRVRSPSWPKGPASG
jgi:type I restriction enzyme R subunit